MANHKSAKKRIRQTEKRKLRNQAYRSKLNTLLKGVYGAENKEQATAKLKETVSFIDKAVSKGKLHKNTAARKKSRLTKHVNALTV